MSSMQPKDALSSAFFLLIMCVHEHSLVVFCANILDILQLYLTAVTGDKFRGASCSTIIKSR